MEHPGCCSSTGTKKRRQLVTNNNIQLAPRVCITGQCLVHKAPVLCARVPGIPVDNHQVLSGLRWATCRMGPIRQGVYRDLLCNNLFVL